MKNEKNKIKITENMLRLSKQTLMNIIVMVKWSFENCGLPCFNYTMQKTTTKTKAGSN